MATFPHSDIAGDTTKWSSFAPVCVNTLSLLVGNHASANRNVCTRTLVNMSKHIPTMVAFVDARLDRDIISFGLVFESQSKRTSGFFVDDDCEAVGCRGWCSIFQLQRVTSPSLRSVPLRARKHATLHQIQMTQDVTS